METLPDRPCRPGGILLIGINPAPISVAAGHYYQGPLGQRTWQRLARIGLLSSLRQGLEDEAFIAAGHGLTDIVKRPTASADEILPAEFIAGKEVIRSKIAAWRPGLLLFVFKPPAAHLLGDSVQPGRCADYHNAMTFLLSNPYARADVTAAIDNELRALLKLGLAQEVPQAPVPTHRIERMPAPIQTVRESPPAQTQRVTAIDKKNGRIRIPKRSKSLFPAQRTLSLPVTIRDKRVKASYDPRIGQDRSRSAVLGVGRQILGTIDTDEVLTITLDRVGQLQLD
jgi:TDG/mug DNA glycosylase family protein